MQNAKPTLGVIVGNRNFFADSLVAEGRKKILAKLAEFGIDVVIVDEASQLSAVGLTTPWRMPEAKAKAKITNLCAS